jgi:di/tricarboxylate transporter
MVTSTNLVVHEYARSHGLPGFTMFELGQVGLPLVAVTFVYLIVIGRVLLPRNRVDGDELAQSGDYLAELVIAPGSSWAGTKVGTEKWRRDHDLELIALSRGGDVLDPDEEGRTLEAGDALRVRGRLEDVLKLAARGGIDLHKPHDAPAGQAGEAPREPIRLAEVVLLPGNRLIGRSLKDVDFARVHDAVVVALRRRGRAFGRPSTTRLRTGDVLVLEGTNAALLALSSSNRFLVVGTPQAPEVRHDKIVIAVATLVAVVTVVALGWMSIVAAATLGCALLMLSGCLRPREAYEAIDLSVVFLLAGSLAIGAALEQTGVPGMLAGLLESAGGGANPVWVMTGFYLVAVVLSEFMSNSGSAALLCPIAVSVGRELGIEPMTLLVAVTFGCSAAFAMPIGYQTSLMVLGPGGYRFRDFVRVGLVLDVIVALIVLALIPSFWSFAPATP